MANKGRNTSGNKYTRINILKAVGRDGTSKNLDNTRNRMQNPKIKKLLKGYDIVGCRQKYLRQTKTFAAT
jgi:hypothetical protein